jgi:UDP-N-acetylglucosamine 2-epimerase
MYESHFGIAAPPFQLDPDPNFFFSSRGHQGVLAELRRGFEEGARVLVVSGETGVGKTTLIRAAAAELDPAWVVVAQIASARFDDVGLLRALQIAFGFQVDSGPREHRARRLGEFAATLGRDYRRPVLIIDDAQNLLPAAFDLLAALQALWPIGVAPLQVCLVGQLELRAMLESPEKQALKALATVTCHLGSLQAFETSEYIEYRLKQVGWAGIPSFEQGTFEEIFRCTGGIPRRINLLCDRLLISRFLTTQERIEVATVAEVAYDVRRELELAQPFSSPSEGHPPTPVAAQQDEPEDRVKVQSLFSAVDAAPIEEVADDLRVEADWLDHPVVTATGPFQEPGPVRKAWPKVPLEEQSLLCVVGGHGDHVKAAALLHVLADRPHLPALVLVRVFDNLALDYNKALFGRVQLPGRVINLGIKSDSHAERAETVMREFETVFDHCHPAAAIVFDNSDAALPCALVASRRSVPVVHIGAGQRRGAERGAVDSASKQIDHLSGVLYAADADAVARLKEEGIPERRIQFVGNLVADSLNLALRASGDGPRIPDVFEPSVQDVISSRRGYGVVLVDAAANINDSRNLAELVALVRAVSRDLPLLWLMHDQLRAELAASHLDVRLAIENVVCAPLQHYAAYVKLLSDATCVLTDSSIVQDEATALDVPCLTIGVAAEAPIGSVTPNLFVGNNRTLAVRAVWDCKFNGGKGGQTPTLWDGNTAERIAYHLEQWLQHQQQT